MALEQELETFAAKLPELMANEGKWALIHADRVFDVFTSYEDAVKAGYREFGVDQQFLVKQIQAVETTFHLTRFVEPAHRAC